jgi:hypothetical protein
LLIIKNKYDKIETNSFTPLGDGGKKKDPAELRSNRARSRFQIANNLKPKQNYEENF